MYVDFVKFYFSWDTIYGVDIYNINFPEQKQIMQILLVSCKF